MTIILTGKTASGKDTIKKILLQRFPNLKRIVTTTSRVMRQGEQPDIDYHFISRDDFQKKIEAGEFIEYVEYGGNLYGTTKEELSKTLGGNLLWKIDPFRAGRIRELIKENLVIIYITTSGNVILQRLKNRGLSKEEIQKRMADDEIIWRENRNNYDFIVDNIPGKLDETIDKITKLIESHASQI